ncbi:CaiB/BaiF CoA-transferase family protein [Mesorhizobium sp. 1M-11]|uniref:CaiB/BaiF CoA transferase family protein n=1 Tax=Mesorhizobium sp. 1M-11 TaxID=1529006 RepID=UPI0006C76002|nr:CaiB/BaiF CoA-transferase family protein [Mesorhizobium sp. 1M-11]
MTLPLDGVHVLDLSRILAGPSCSQILGDLGADVIKVERPGVGDDTRAWGPPFLKAPEAGQAGGDSAYFLSANRNKRSVTVDLGVPEGVEVVRDLAIRSDVLVENFKVGDLARKGLGWEQLRASNPSLIYCSVTGFGQTGPYAQRPGYDFIIQGMSGLMSITGEADGPPMKAGIPISDILAGLYAGVSILAALHDRNRTGRGRYVDISMLECQIASLFFQSANFLLSGNEPKRWGNAHPSVVPYQTFETRDGIITLGVGNDVQFTRICAIAGKRALAHDARYATNAARLANRVSLIAALSSSFRENCTSHWIEKCSEAGIACGPVNTLEQALTDPHIRASRLIQNVPHPEAERGHIDILRAPMRVEGAEIGIRRAPPTLGQHTREILKEVLGYSSTKIQRLARAGAI